jgi:hypothetical protein
MAVQIISAENQKTKPRSSRGFFICRHCEPKRKLLPLVIARRFIAVAIHFFRHCEAIYRRGNPHPQCGNRSLSSLRGDLSPWQSISSVIARRFIVVAIHIHSAETAPSRHCEAIYRRGNPFLPSLRGDLSPWQSTSTMDHRVGQSCPPRDDASVFHDSR